MPNWLSDDELRDMPNDVEVAEMDARQRRYDQESREIRRRREEAIRRKQAQIDKRGGIYILPSEDVKRRLARADSYQSLAGDMWNMLENLRSCWEGTALEFFCQDLIDRYEELADG